MEEIKLLGNITNFDPVTNEVTLKLDFLNITKQEVIEQILEQKLPIAFRFTKPGRRMKTHAQLKRYFWMLKLILQVKKVFPSAKALKTLDEYVKKSLIECEHLEFQEGEELIRIPILPSKADMSIDELNSLMQAIEDHYTYLKIDWSTGKVAGRFNE